MFSLRQINNNFAGGARSDFGIVKHPEYQLGKIASGTGYGALWDTTPVPMYPKRGPAADRLRRSGSEQLVHRLGAPPRPPLKERASGKSQPTIGTFKEAQAADLRADFDRFLALLRSPEAIPAYEPSERVLAGASNHLSSGGTCRHYEFLRDELSALVERLRRDPEGTERDLLMSDSWRYYAQRLEKARRRQIQQRKAQRAFATAAAPRS